MQKCPTLPRTCARAQPPPPFPCTRSLGSAIDQQGTSRHSARQPKASAEPDQATAAREADYNRASCAREAKLLEDVARLPCLENVGSYAALAAMHRYNRAQTNSFAAHDSLNLHLLARGGMQRTSKAASIGRTSRPGGIHASPAQIPEPIGMGNVVEGACQANGYGAAASPADSKHSAMSPYGLDDGGLMGASGVSGKVGGDVGAAAPGWASAGGDGGVAGGEGGWAREYASPLVSSPIGQINSVSSGPSEAADKTNPTSDTHDVKAGTGAAVAPVVLGACALCCCVALYVAAAAPPPLTLTLLSRCVSADVVLARRTGR